MNKVPYFWHTNPVNETDDSTEHLQNKDEQEEIHMSKNYNRYSEENKETDKYGMTDETNENAKTQKKENRYGSDSYDKSSSNRYSDKNRQ